MKNETAIVAHYYATEDVKRMADYVGDSLDLAVWITENKPKRVIHASVKFMAETAKILNPETEVILPDPDSTCSLVTQTDINDLKQWSDELSDHIHVAYINSSAAHKATADIIVTSRIVDDVISKLYEAGMKVCFSPDRNMGEYLNYTYDYKMPVWSAVCEVHDKFKAEELDIAIKNGGKTMNWVLAHPESPLPVLKKADYVGSTHGMLNWVEALPKDPKDWAIWIATEEGLLYNMRQARPDLDIRQAPTYDGCKCSVCPYMKKNTIAKVHNAATHGLGLHINYMTDAEMEAARRPIKRMMEYNKTGVINLR